MPLLRINATTCGLVLHGSAQPIGSALATVRAVPQGTVIMVHGYKYSPRVTGRSPHRRLFGPKGWPKALDLPAENLCVAFGWHARGGLRRAYLQALERAQGLADLICALRPHGPVHLIAHSMGATLTLAALPYLRRGDVGRIVLLNGAAHQGLAHHALASPAGRTSTLFHVTSRENRLFDLGFERIIEGTGTIARGLVAPQAQEIQISCPQTLAALEKLGYPVAGPARRICHWSSYTRPGVMSLNAALLNGALPPEVLRAALPTRQRTRVPWALALRRKTTIMDAQSNQEGTPNGHAY